MSVQLPEHDSIEQMTTNIDDFSLPANTAALVKWLDDPANFITVERTYTAPRRESASYGRFRRPDKTVTESRWLNPDYEVDTRACYDSQQGVCDAWEDMKFPKHRIETVEGVTGAYLYTWSSSGSPPRRRFRRRGRSQDDEKVINYEAVQHPDGHGVIRHYETIAAVRTKSGLVINNEQDYGGGFALLTQPDADHELPLSGVSNVLDGQDETVFDIESVSRDQTRIRYTTKRDPIGGHDIVTGVREAFDNDRQVTRVNLRSGGAVIILHDSTANNADEEKCGFYLEPVEADLYDGAQGALNALQPVDVLQARERGLDIVPSDEYAGNGAGGFYDDSLLGDCVIRQGEWYLIPMDEDWEPDAPVYKPLPKARRDSKWDFSHVDMESHLEVDSVIGEFPEDCPECGATNFEVAARDPTAVCLECDEAFGFGAFDPEDFVDDGMLNRYQEALDTLDSHRPRDLVVADNGGYFVRGSFRHVDNEHKMLNLKDRWHMVAENTRDVLVFDLGQDSGGVARFE